jgi:hypothetical protein
MRSFQKGGFSRCRAIRRDAGAALTRYFSTGEVMLAVIRSQLLSQDLPFRAFT